MNPSDLLAALRRATCLPDLAPLRSALDSQPQGAVRLALEVAYGIEYQRISSHAAPVTDIPRTQGTNP